LRKLKKRVVEEQDRSSQSESERRRSENEINKLRETARFLREELDKAKSDTRNAIEEKRELEDRAKAISGLFR